MIKGKGMVKRQNLKVHLGGTSTNKSSILPENNRVEIHDPFTNEVFYGVEQRVKKDSLLFWIINVNTKHLVKDINKKLKRIKRGYPLMIVSPHFEEPFFGQVKYINFYYSAHRNEKGLDFEIKTISNIEFLKQCDKFKRKNKGGTRNA